MAVGNVIPLATARLVIEIHHQCFHNQWFKYCQQRPGTRRTLAIMCLLCDHPSTNSSAPHVLKVPHQLLSAMKCQVAACPPLKSWTVAYTLSKSVKLSAFTAHGCDHSTICSRKDPRFKGPLAVVGGCTKCVCQPNKDSSSKSVARASAAVDVRH